MAQSVYQVSWNFNIAGQFASSVFHWQFDDAGYATTNVAAGALINAWQTRDLTHFKQLIPSAVTFLTMKARKVGSVGGFESVGIFVAGTVGLRAGNLAAAGVSPVVIFYPSNNGKLRGKWFIPGLSESDCAGGVLTNAFKTIATTNIGLMFDDLTLVGGGAPVANHGVYSRATNTFTHMTFERLSDLIGTQRRRQRPA